MTHVFTAMSSPRGRAKAFTLVEIAIASFLFMFLASIGLGSVMMFTEQRKVRSAAVELSGYLQVARSVAYAENIRCQIDLTDSTLPIFAPTTSKSFPDNACLESVLPPSINLRALSGSRNLTATTVGFPLIFNPGGTLGKGAMVRLGSTDVPNAFWCVDVRAPLATIHLGVASSVEAACQFAIEE